MKRLLKMRMMRTADACLPGAFLLVSLLGRYYLANNIFLAVFIARLLALASARGLRQAFSEQPSMQKVTGSVATALLLQLFGVAVMLLVNFIRNHTIPQTHWVYAGIALLLNIEHIFYEYLYATGDSYSATMCRAITTALFTGGLLMTSVSSHDGLLAYALEWPLGGAAVSALVAALIGLSIGGPFSGGLNPQVLICAPLAMLQSLAYPLFWVALSLIPNSPLCVARTFAPFFAGLMLCELCRAPFRRASMESREMNRNLLIVCAASLAVILVFIIPPVQDFLRIALRGWFFELPPTAVSLIAASACAFGLYGRA